MNRNKLIYGGVFIIFVIIIIYTFQGDETPEAYNKRITKAREEQRSYMINNEESPFVANEVEFHGLRYFKPDLKYKIKARFTPTENPEIRKLSTSDGKVKEYIEYGNAIFTIEDQKQTLLILENVQEKILFLAFGDATSANETYGGGRYLEVTHSGGNSIDLDFNMAYNPYCAYTEGYSCPLPPRENLLDVAIAAGEKTYHED